MDEELRRDLDRFVEENETAIFRDIARLVAINSVEGEPSEGAPFGPGPKAALEKGLEIARELGLKAVNCADKIGYAQLGEGAEDRYLATITHLDVVPTGEGWEHDPFTMREREGWIIGRGVLDDKGPSVLCLYALKYLKERNIPLRYPIRVLLGANEETGMGDVEYYLANYPAPLFCFSPDANFPLCNGEKGIYHGRILFHVALNKIREIRGGIVANAIPDKAEALVEAEHLENAERVTVEQQEEPGLWRVRSVGLGGHASLPEGTVNAIGVLVDYLLANGIGDENERHMLKLLQKLHSDWRGRGLGVQADDGRDRCGGREGLPDSGQPLSHQHQRREDRGDHRKAGGGSGGGHRGPGCRALLHEPGQSLCAGLHQRLQRRHRRKCQALHHRRRHLCPGFPQRGLLRTGASRAAHAGLCRSHPRRGRGGQQGLSAGGAEGLHPGAGRTGKN